MSAQDGSVIEVRVGLFCFCLDPDHRQALDWFVDSTLAKEGDALAALLPPATAHLRIYTKDHGILEADA